MNAFYRIIGGLVVALVVGSGQAQAQQQRKIVLSENQFRESFLEKVTVSGGIRAGFMYKSPLERVDARQLYIHLQRDLDDPQAMLCVNMVSRDGRYAASWQYAIGSQPAGAINVDLPSKYQEQMSSYSPDALVVLAGIAKQSCAAPDLKYIPASWGEARAADYILYVNSGNTDTIIGVPGRTERIPCAKIAADNTIAYDTQCVIGREVLAEPKSIFLVRNSFGNKLPNVEFPVR
ncbi:hypothetical protein [Desulfobulbus sp.]|uniref:hypothetical protein n=1 Tax=Desulfobulbus sp. TaxID=895 RepID=UPI00286EBA59|nr:hypothetical protein [Desulfobulbus sp.]